MPLRKLPRHLIWLESFAAAVDTGSLEGAAEHLGVARSVVSEHIRALEAALGEGEPLLERGPGRRLQLTARGQRLYAGTQTPLHQLDCESDGFEWLASHDEENSVFAWLRKDREGRTVLVVCNFTPVPRHGYRIGCPAGRWRELLNTDSHHYGGSNVGNGPDARATEAVAAHGRPDSLALTLPPLATVFLVPA